MLLLILKLLGWVIAHSPEALLRPFAALLGDLIYFGVRGRLIRSNLSHAFPDRSAAWQRTIGRASCRRMIETGLLSLATPYLSPARLRQIVSVTPDLIASFESHRTNPEPTLICSPHIAYWEAQTSMSLVIPGSFPEFGTIYRPLDNAAADAFVKASREKYGMRLLSRKEGFAEALKILRRRGFVGVLFDQNAGMHGALTLLFDRVCSTSELPGLMAEKFKARVYGIFPRRLGFWRVEISLERIDYAGSSQSLTLALNRWLEHRLQRDENLCASWLWAHARWRNQDIPDRRLRLEAKRDLVAEDLAARGLSRMPRRTRIWIRLPNWLGDVVMALPLLRALRTSRPDAEITLVARPHFLPLLATWDVADQLHALPPKGFGYLRHFRRLRTEHVDVWLLFTNSFRGDLEAWLSGARQRFGIVRPGRHRRLLTHAYNVPADFDETRHHQFGLWEAFLRRFGLAGTVDRSPVRMQAAASTSDRPGLVAPPGRAPIGLIPGSENAPEKRWPVPHWRALIESMPDETFVVFGTANDAAIAEAVCRGFDGSHVTNLAGRTNLVEFAARLATCRLLIANDTGGMHLANALGVPVVALFGPTNPVRTGPIHAGLAVILQPPGCPATGGAALANLTPPQVRAALPVAVAGAGGANAAG